MNYPTHNTPNIVIALQLVDELKNQGYLVLDHLRAYIEKGLEAKQPGGSQKWLCAPNTFSRYRRLAFRAKNDSSGVVPPLGRVMKVIPEPTFLLILDYFEKVKPGVVAANFDVLVED